MRILAMNMNKVNYLKNLFKYILSFVVLAFLLSSCEDPVPSDYIPETLIEAVLIVDEPIENIIIMRTQPLNKAFDYNASLIDDAEVKIWTEEKEYNLIFRKEDKPGYFYPDTSEKVKSETTYFLEVTLKDGAKITGKTTTPKRSHWVYLPQGDVYYPKDTLKLAPIDSLRIEFAPLEGKVFYILGIACIDSLGYGEYLTPASDEKNRRIIRPWNEGNERFFSDLTTWTFLPTNKTPIVWTVFKWFGKHRALVYFPDENYFNWFLQYVVKASYDPLLSSVEGGIGVFGSASKISHDFFLYKNQK
ncbi:MAG: DUF4249 family protein [Ignavibacteria bacterium]|nr:DUF4249 family protein [Ignavibacteria bacterium]